MRSAGRRTSRTDIPSQGEDAHWRAATGLTDSSLLCDLINSENLDFGLKWSNALLFFAGSFAQVRQRYLDRKRTMATVRCSRRRHRLGGGRIMISRERRRDSVAIFAVASRYTLITGPEELCERC
jgi:hypothetical protein